MICTIYSTSFGKEAVVHPMDADRPIDPEVADKAEQALSASLSDLVEVAADLTSSPAPAAAAGVIADLCRDAAYLADAIAIIARRTAR